MTRQEISAELRRAADALEAADELPDITGNCTISEVCAALSLLEHTGTFVELEIALKKWSDDPWECKVTIHDGAKTHAAPTLRLAYDKLLASRREKQPPDPIAAVETLVAAPPQPIPF